jgi:lanosterol synthase
MLEGGYGGDARQKEVLKRAVRLIMERQMGNGEWVQEAIEGVFNKSW